MGNLAQTFVNGNIDQSMSVIVSINAKRFSESALTDRQTDTQTDALYQMHHLPTSLSLAVGSDIFILNSVCFRY